MAFHTAHLDGTAGAVRIDGRRAAVYEQARWFNTGHHDPDSAAWLVARHFENLAAEILIELPDSDDLVAALRQLLVAKDTAVRAAIVAAAEVD